MGRAAARQNQSNNEPDEWKKERRAAEVPRLDAIDRWHRQAGQELKGKNQAAQVHG